MFIVQKIMPLRIKTIIIVFLISSLEKRNKLSSVMGL